MNQNYMTLILKGTILKGFFIAVKISFSIVVMIRELKEQPIEYTFYTYQGERILKWRKALKVESQII